MKKLGAVDNCRRSKYLPTFRGMKAESMDPANKPRGGEFVLNCQQTRSIGFLFLCLVPLSARAGELVKHIDPVTSVIPWVTLIFLFGILGRLIAQRLKQPGVLGELLMGILLGNLCYWFAMPLDIILREGSNIFNLLPDILSGFSLLDAIQYRITDPHTADQLYQALSGPQGMDYLKIAYIVDIFSRYGVIFMLFIVGLDNSIEDLKKTGAESLRVAIIGVLLPIILGLFLMAYIDPVSSFNSDLFVAATLSATSIGITARILKEEKKLNTREAKTILGAAMLDDIFGLIILAIVSSIVISGRIDLPELGQIITLTLVFFIAVLTLGPWILRKLAWVFRDMEPWQAKLFISFIFLMTLAWVASIIQLAAIIGAFAAGIILHDGFFDSKTGTKNNLRVKDLVAPLEFVLAPLFFMLIGIQVKLELFCNVHVLILSVGFIAAAILGKLLSGLGGSRRDDRLLIGIGMLPRGEVGLVFASIGKTLSVMSDQVFSAIIFMILVTTLITPPWLKSRYLKEKDIQNAA